MNKLNLKELKNICRKNSIKKYSSLNKGELVKYIEKMKKIKVGGTNPNELLNKNKLLELLNTDEEGLTKLKKLDLSNHKITNIEPNTFNQLSNIEYLILSHNKIKNIKPNTFNGLSNLKYLYLRDNEITEIEPNAFNGLSNLHSLFLENNKITKIEPNAFNGLSNLKYLFLQDNKITKIEPNAFNGLDDLTHLYLSNINLDSTNSYLSKTYLNLLSFIGLKNIVKINFINNNKMQIESKIKSIKYLNTYSDVILQILVDLYKYNNSLNNEKLTKIISKLITINTNKNKELINNILKILQGFKDNILKDINIFKIGDILKSYFKNNILLN